MAYQEVEDIARIGRLGEEFVGLLEVARVFTETRTIGYPSGHEIREVRFLEENGPDSLWFAHWLSKKDGKKRITLFGHGAPGENSALSIDVQFNYPTVDFNRRLGGVFLEDPVTNEVVLAHRGIVTLGQRVKKDSLFDAMSADLLEAETSVHPMEFLQVASLSSETLVDDLSQFSKRLRSTVRGLGAEPDLMDEPMGQDPDEQLADAGEGDPIPDIENGIEGLRKYFMEFSRKRRAFTPKRVYPDSHHGKVVHAMHERLEKLGPTLKSRAVDLVSDQDDFAILYEVKTNAGSQSVFTAIGQLCVYAITVKRLLRKPVFKVLVVPERPMGQLSHIIENQLDVRIVTYSMSSGGTVAFNDLDTASPPVKNDILLSIT